MVEERGGSFQGRRIALHLTPEAERAVRAGHPWVFDSSIIKQNHEANAGDLAVIFDKKNRFLAVGLYDPYSTIRVRVLQHHQQEKIDEAWLHGRIREAIKLRNSIEENETTAYRLVHGENDGLPALVIDRYGPTLVLKLYSAIWIPYLPAIRRTLLDAFPAERIVLRLSRFVERSTSEPDDGTRLYGPPISGPIRFLENGLSFETDPSAGHKTGFYLDQRENRARVEAVIRADSSIGRVLDVFAYSGAFSLYAARAGAQDIAAIDINQQALDTAERCFGLNQAFANVARARFVSKAADAFDEMNRLASQGEKFDAVLVDPPSFANKRSQVDAALVAYGRLVRLAMALLRPGGLFVMSSCSSRVEQEPFFDRVTGEVIKSGRTVEELARTGHPVDHPVSFPEGAYLKCLFAYVH